MVIQCMDRKNREKKYTQRRAGIRTHRNVASPLIAVRDLSNSLSLGYAERKLKLCHPPPDSDPRVFIN